MLFMGFLTLCRWLPLPVNHALGAVIGLVYACFSSHDKRVASVNLSIAFPSLSPWRRSLLLLSFFMELGKTFTEMGKLWLMPVDRLMRMIRSVDGVHHLEDALAHGQGALFLTPHIGAWELAGLYLPHFAAMTTLYQPPHYASVAAFITKARERSGAQLVPTDISGVRALLSALKHNQIAGILPDQDPGETGGVFAPFFGKPTNTMVLAGRLAHKSQSPVLLIACERLAWGRGYRMHLTPCDVAIRDVDPVIAATALNRSLASVIELMPEQYIWNYKRWRRQPDGQNPYQGK